MDLFKLCALALIGICVTAFFKQARSEMLPVVRIAVLTVLAVCAITAAEPILTYLYRLTQLSILTSEHTKLLFKVAGISVLTHYCAELCRESGESEIASGVETVGKIQLLLLSLPLLEEIFSAVDRLLEIGGTV